jgi:hypothetical protein
MSKVKLNLVDAQKILVGTVHGSVADACIAALTAEPETIAELEVALARYIKPGDHGAQFVLFTSGSEIDSQPCDAGLVIVDLAAQVVAVESTYSQPGPEGVVAYHNGKHATEIPIRYVLSDQWLFVYSFESYRSLVEQRGAQRLAQPPIDTRAVLYGRSLLEFIVEFETGLRRNGFALPPSSKAAADAVADEIVKAHAIWLTTAREDLGDRAPRDVMLEKRHVIDMDLDSRSFQWSMQNDVPPCLPSDSFGFLYAGFGTHEWVVYYALVRYLLCMATIGNRSGSNVMESLKSLVADVFPETIESPSEYPSSGDSGVSPAELADRFTSLSIDQLQRLKSDWLESPQDNYDGMTPAHIIESERKRLPIALTAEQLIIDENCECCQMLARDAEMGCPTFWHLDGCNMEDEFPFSTCRTIQEWEAENRQREELDLEFACRDLERRESDRRNLDRELEDDDWEPLRLEPQEMVDLIQRMRSGEWDPRERKAMDGDDLS